MRVTHFKRTHSQESRLLWVSVIHSEYRRKMPWTSSRRRGKETTLTNIYQSILLLTRPAIKRNHVPEPNLTGWRESLAPPSILPHLKEVRGGGGWEALVKFIVQGQRFTKRMRHTHRLYYCFPFSTPCHYIIKSLIIKIYFTHLFTFRQKTHC